MIEICDSAPPVVIDEAEYVRLLGYPRGHALTDRARELAHYARAWYDRHGRPWMYAREVDMVQVDDDRVVMGGQVLHARRLARMFRDAGADRAVLVAVSAGAEIERAAHEAWRAERPDEYFFLEMYGSAVVEHLTTQVGARLCAWADGERMAVLPHDSPGYPEWDISEQGQLLDLINRDELPGALDVLESGMLRPKKSLLAVFGVTSHVDRVGDLRQLVPCEQCAFTPCQFRRARYGRAATADPDTPAQTVVAEVPEFLPSYSTSVRALRRWATERLTLSHQPDGTIEAAFRYDGSTCSNMGRSLAFRYLVRLWPRAGAYVIAEQRCEPVDGDDGYQSMCAYIREGDRLIDDIRGEAPLAGRPLDDVLGWPRPLLGPGCYCEADVRLHKWGLVLETIHFALTTSGGHGRP
jgi:hypothetical protein